jgi:hypothetical protein
MKRNPKNYLPGRKRCMKDREYERYEAECNRIIAENEKILGRFRQWLEKKNLRRKQSGATLKTWTFT